MNIKKSFWAITLALAGLLLTVRACKKSKSPPAPAPQPSAPANTNTATGTPTQTSTRTNTYAIGFTNTYTHAGTSTPTRTATATVTRTITPFPTPPCGATAGTMGETHSYGPAYSTWYHASPVRLYMTRYNLDRPVTALSLSAYVAHMDAAASIRMGLYSSDGAGNPLIYLDGTNNTGVVMGWNKLALTSERYLESGTYWIAANMQTSAGSTFAVCEWGIDNYWIVDYPNPTPQVFPNPASLATPYGAPYGPSLFMEFCPAPTYTPTIAPTATLTPTPRCTAQVSPALTPIAHTGGYEPDYCAYTPVVNNPPLGLGYIPPVTTPSPVDRQKVVTGSLTPGDIDYFLFIARSTGTYTFYLDCFGSGAGLNDVDLFLWNPNCPTTTQLATTNGQTGTLKVMTYNNTVVDATYYLTVREMTTSRSCGYRVVLNSP